MFSLSGTTGKYVVSNPGTSDISGWKLKFDLPMRRDGEQPAERRAVAERHDGDADPGVLHQHRQGGRKHRAVQPDVHAQLRRAAANCTLNGANCDGTGEPPPTLTGVTAEYTVSGTSAKFVVANHTSATIDNWSVVFDLLPV